MDSRSALLAFFLSLLFAGCVSQQAQSGEPAPIAPKGSGIADMLLVNTCSEPVVISEDPPNYSVTCTPPRFPELADVTITSLNGTINETKLSTTGGYFEIAVPPGNYVVKTIITDGGEQYELFPQDAVVVPGKYANLTYLYQIPNKKPPAGQPG